MSDMYRSFRDDPHTYYALAFGVGVIAAGVMTLLTYVAQRAGWTTFDLAMTLGTVSVFVDAPGPGVWFQGLIAVLVTGGLFALIYAAVFEFVGLRGARAWRGVLLGAIHAVIGGALMGWTMPLVHDPIKSSPLLTDPGFMAWNYGMQTVAIFVALHLVFGAIVGGWLHFAPLAQRHLEDIGEQHKPSRPVPM